MAIVNNPLLGEISGKFGTGVFSQLNGKTVLRAKPECRKFKPSPKQQAQYDKVSNTCLEVRKILHDPIRRAEYNAKCPPGYSLYHRIMKDLLTPKPEK